MVALLQQQPIGNAGQMPIQTTYLFHPKPKYLEFLIRTCGLSLSESKKLATKTADHVILPLCQISTKNFFCWISLPGFHG
ncbi:MAG: hypothetical protein ACK5WY_01395 [Holosporaceae bacterium]|jgi:hypothetical protein|nr:hypothetical protein [Rhodospirillaceae bacterium]